MSVKPVHNGRPGAEVDPATERATGARTPSITRSIRITS